MVQALFDEGVLVRDGTIKVTRPVAGIKVPPTVQGILVSRIDRLPVDEKELLQVLAVLGRQFPLGIVRQMTRKADEELDRMLSSLQLAEFIYEQPTFPEVEY